MAKTDITHLDGCPKKPIEPTERHFLSKAQWYQVTGHRCLACGAATRGKRKKIDQEDL